jgi:hypothetical protein
LTELRLAQASIERYTGAPRHQPPIVVEGPTDLMSVFETRPTSAERPTWARSGSCCLDRLVFSSAAETVL